MTESKRTPIARLQKSRSRLPASRRSPEHPSSTAATEPLPIDAIYPLYPGEWVAVKVTALDERQAISHGEVLAHSRSQKRVSAALLRTHQEDPTAHTYLFFGGSEPTTAEEWRERLAQAVAKMEDYKDCLYGWR